MFNMLCRLFFEERARMPENSIRHLRGQVKNRIPELNIFLKQYRPNVQTKFILLTTVYCTGTNVVLSVSGMITQ